MRNASALKLPHSCTDRADLQNTNRGSNLTMESAPPHHAQVQITEISGLNARQLISTKGLSKRWDIPESTLRYWRCAGLGPAYVKLGGRIKYDLADVERYVRANKRMPSVRAHGG